MRLTISIIAEVTDDFPDQDLNLVNIEVLPDSTVALIKESVQTEARIPKLAQHLYHNGQLLSDDSRTLEQLQIADGDMLMLHVRDMEGSRVDGSTGAQARRSPQPVRRPVAGQNARGGDEPDPEVLRLQALGNPGFQRQLQAQQPELAAAINDPSRFAQLYRQVLEQDRMARYQRQQQIAALNADPFDLEAQKRIEEMIREERVQENLQNAIEHNPEVFGRVHMLYINVEVNGHKVKAFVDSGAQATIMSPSCAESCGIMRLVDKRFAGIARGVGTANILGRVHSAQIKIGSIFLPCSFTVMEGKDVDLLLGLDMLKRHQAVLDLSKDSLVIQGVEVPFLGEAEIPKNMEEARVDEPTVAGPGGTTIGAKSGAVSAPGTGQASASSTPQITPAPAAQAAPQRAAPQTSGPRFPPEHVQQLVSLGFSEEEALHALQACDGNVEFAAGMLFG